MLSRVGSPGREAPAVPKLPITRMVKTEKGKIYSEDPLTGVLVDWAEQATKKAKIEEGNMSYREWKLWRPHEKNLADREAPEETGLLVCVYVVDENNRRIARVEGPTKSDLTPNARLIAASPRMLEALKAVYADIDLQTVRGGSDELNVLVQQAIAKGEEAVY